MTPSIKLGVLPGVMRDTIISISNDLHLNVKETNITLNSINDMDEAFISSTGIGLLPCKWDGWKSNFNMTFQIKNKLDQLINKSKWNWFQGKYIINKVNFTMNTELKKPKIEQKKDIHLAVLMFYMLNI